MADTAQLRITADTSDAERALGRLNTAIKSLATVATISALSKFADELTGLQNKLNQVKDAGQTSTDMFNLMAKSALMLGAPIKDVGDLFFRISNTTRDLGVNQSEVLRVTEVLTKGFQLNGQSAAMAAGSTLQLGQAFAQGVLRGDELNSVMEGLPSVSQALADKFGVQVGALKALGEQGKITSRDLFDAITKSGAAIDAAWGQRIPTIAESFNRLQTVVGVVTQRFDQQTGVSQVLSYALLIVASAVIDISEWFQKWGKVIFYVTEAIALLIIPARAATAVLLNFGKVVEFIAAPFIALGEAIAGSGSAIAQFFSGGIFALVGAKIVQISSNIRDLFSEDKTSLADKYNKKLEEINKRLGLDAVEASNQAKKASEALTAQQLKDAEAIRKATQSRDIELKKIIQSQTDSLALTRFNGDAESIESTILSTNRSLIKEIMNDKQQIIGTTKGLNAEEERNMRIALQNLEIARQQQALKALKAPESTSQVTSRASSIFGQTQGGLEIEANRQKSALDLLDANKMLKEREASMNSEYADQEVLINKAKNDAILANDQKVAEARMAMAGVTNNAITDAVKAQMANVQMMQQNGIVGAQGVLGAMDNIMSSMGAHNKKAFEAHKALATAQALISTYQAAAAALAMPPGPPVSFIYVAGAIAAGMAQVATIQSQNYSGKALGGSVSGNTPYIVGEKGPEMFVPAGSGTIVPNSEITGGKNVNINFTIQATDATGFDTLLTQRRGMITQFVRDALAEQGQRSAM